ncbi:MAG: site-specific DNA-methyltransferase [Oscillospiraceae bacterium]|jgi:site-specific DNA-methyltransferase (adenine-specific)|nr:site-specific DNA-methyltransferase [Oscillospiraceae bacterium]
MYDVIIPGNSADVLKTLPDEYVHAIITDIPYGICYDGWDVLHNNTNSALGGSSVAQSNGGALFRRRGKPLNGWSAADKRIPLEYQEWCASWAGEWLRVLKPGSSCLVFAGRRLAPRCVVALEDAGFTFKDMLAWKKSTAPHRAQRISEIYKRRGDTEHAVYWQGWRVANLRPVFEPVLWFQKPYKTGGTIADNVLEYGVGAWNESAISGCCIESYGSISCSNVLSVPYEKDDHGLHETQKPLRLMECLVSLVTQETAIVLDPFAGSGTTCLAAKKLNRRYIGVEIDADYVEVARKRIANSAALD